MGFQIEEMPIALQSATSLADAPKLVRMDLILPQSCDHFAL